MPTDTLRRRAAPLPALLAALALTAACAGPGALARYDGGLEREIRRHYAANAMEENARCPSPRMRTVTRAELVEDTPERVVMDIGYTWIDDGQTVDVGGSSLSICQDFGQRRFTFARDSDGGLRVERMSGPRPRG